MSLSVKEFPQKLKEGKEYETLLMPQLEHVFPGFIFEDISHKKRDENALMVPDFLGYHEELDEYIYVDAKCRKEYQKEKGGSGGYYGVDEFIWKDYILRSYMEDRKVFVSFWNKDVDTDNTYILNIKQEPCFRIKYKNAYTRFKGHTETAFRWHKSKLIKRSLID